MINTPQLSMPIATMDGEIVDVNVRLNQAIYETVIFQNVVIHTFEFPEAWVATSRLGHCLLV